VIGSELAGPEGHEYGRNSRSPARNKQHDGGLKTVAPKEAAQYGPARFSRI